MSSKSLPTDGPWSPPPSRSAGFLCSCGFRSDTSSTFYKHVVMKAEKAPEETHTRVFSTPDSRTVSPPGRRGENGDLSPMPILRPTSSGSNIATPSPMAPVHNGSQVPSPLVRPQAWSLPGSFSGSFSGSLGLRPLPVAEEAARREDDVKNAILRARETLLVLTVSRPLCVVG